MPKVGKKHFPYTSAGIAAAKAAKSKGKRPKNRPPGNLKPSKKGGLRR